MPTTRSETYVARLTPRATSALATISIGGPRAVTIAQHLFRGGKTALQGGSKTGRFYYGPFGDEIRDDVVLRIVKLSPDGEVEIHCHGGVVMTDALIDAIVRAGAVQVPWQDYLRETGAKEIEVEATEALSRCASARCAAILLDQHGGALQAAFNRIAETGCQSTVRRLLRWAELGLHLIQPWHVVLVGRPNVGKSSLLNAMAGFQRAIVADSPGTTRDVVSVEVMLDGWPLQLSDGAGLREDGGPLETEGILRLRDRAKLADLCVVVLDTSRELMPEDRDLCRQFDGALIVGSKGDLISPWRNGDLQLLHVQCSSKTGAGIDLVAAAVVVRLVPQTPAPGEPVPFTERQVAWIMQHAPGGPRTQGNNQ